MGLREEFKKQGPITSVQNTSPRPTVRRPVPPDSLVDVIHSLSFWAFRNRSPVRRLTVQLLGGVHAETHLRAGADPQRDGGRRRSERHRLWIRPGPGRAPGNGVRFRTRRPIGIGVVTNSEDVKKDRIVDDFV